MEYASGGELFDYIWDQNLGGETDQNMELVGDVVRGLKTIHEVGLHIDIKGENIFLNVFPQQQRLCSFFQYIPVHFDGFKVPQVYRKGRQVQEGQKALIFLKPSFSFPFIKPPNMIPCVDQNLVLSQF